MATKTPIPTGLIQRIIAGAKAVIGPDLTQEQAREFNSAPMAPGVPLAPTMRQNDGEQLEARRFDYPVGMNLTTRPRGESTRTRPHVWTAEDLRLFSRAYGLLRIAIETRKSQVIGQAWQVIPRHGLAMDEADPRLVAARALMNKPDGRHCFQDWEKTLLEDLLVIDMVALRIDTTIDGTPLAFRPIDAGTLKVIVDEDGETPLPPLPAYSQIIQGLPASWWDTSEMIVRVFNPATDWIYGYSPVEQIADIVSLGIRRQAHQLNYYTEGNLPESIIVGPTGWDNRATAKFQAYWDALYEGPNALKLKRRTRFLPNGAQLIQAKEAILKDEMDEWLARQICYAFNISPSALTKDNNRAVGETIRDSNLREGLMPLLNWLKTIYDDILARAGFADFEFSWIEEDSLDPLEQAQRDQIYSTIGVKTVNEIRKDLGLKPIEGGDELKPAAAPAQPGQSGDPGMDSFMSMFGMGKRGYAAPIHSHRHDRLVAKGSKKKR